MLRPQNIHVIINPLAACGFAGREWKVIRKHIQQVVGECKEHFTRHTMHACELVQQAVEDHAKLIICVGGDGTFNEIVHGLLSVQRDNLPELAVVPVGSGTDFIRTVGIPRDPPAAIAIIKEGQPRDIDVGKVVFKRDRHEWTRYFVNVFDIGLGGAVVRLANRIPKTLGGFFIYLLSSLSALMSFCPVPMKVRIDSTLVADERIMIVGTANGQYFGGGMHMAPMATVCDGMLDVLYVNELNLFKFVAHVLARVYQGKHLEYYKVHHYRGRNIQVLCDRVCLMDIDGEEEKAQEVMISIIPKAVKIRLPKTRVMD